jgi:ferredoxin
MGTVTFLDPPFLDKSVARPAPYGRTLLNLASSLDLGLQADCRMGSCGDCAVKVAVLGEFSACRIQLGETERSILYKAGKISREQFESSSIAGSKPVWRLACQYVIRNEAILVAL